MAVEVHPATPERWREVVTAFGRRGNDPSWCWCQLFLRPTAKDAEPTRSPDHREALRREVTAAAVPPGLLAFVDKRPVGWSRIGPRAALPRVTGSRSLMRILPPDPLAWWVACFAVDGRHRGSGVGSALLDAAVALAGDNGASAVEGHPVDVAALTAATVGGSALFTGTLTMFTAAGFTEVGRTYRSRPVMRRLL